MPKTRLPTLNDMGETPNGLSDARSVRERARQIRRDASAARGERAVDLFPSFFFFSARIISSGGVFRRSPREVHEQCGRRQHVD